MEISRLLEIIRMKTADCASPEDEDDALASTETILYYVNNALREATLRGRLFISGDFTIDLVAGVREYPVPERVDRITTITDENSRDVVKVQEVDFEQRTYNTYSDFSHSQAYNNDWRNDTDEIPTHYMQHLTNNKVIVYPIPTKDTVLNVRATYFNEELDESDDLPVELPEIYQRGLIHWVLYEYYDTQDADLFDPKASARNRKEFDDMFGTRLNADQYQEYLGYPDNPGSLRDY